MFQQTKTVGLGKTGCICYVLLQPFGRSQAETVGAILGFNNISKPLLTFFSTYLPSFQFSYVPEHEARPYRSLRASTAPASLPLLFNQSFSTLSAIAIRLSMHPSAEIIASWPAPNFKDPVTRGSALTVVNVIFITLVVVVAALRFYTRLRITKSFGLDDWIIGISLVRSPISPHYSILT